MRSNDPRERNSFASAVETTVKMYSSQEPAKSRVIDPASPACSQQSISMLATLSATFAGEG